MNINIPRSIILLSIIFTAAYAAIVYIFYISQDKLIYFPEKNVTVTPSAFGIKYEEIEFKTPDNVKLTGWFISKNKSDKAVILFHGNAGNVSECAAVSKIYFDLGFNVLAFDYRGFGQSEGLPSETGTYTDAQSAWNHLISLGFKPENIVLSGRSLGGSIASWLASKQSPRALIIESSFTSMCGIGQQSYPYLPVKYICRYGYTTEQYLKNVKCPVLVVHSKDDNLVPFNNGLKLYESASEPKEFLEISGGHNEAYYISENKYIAGVKAFLNKM